MKDSKSIKEPGSKTAAVTTGGKEEAKAAGTNSTVKEESKVTAASNASEKEDDKKTTGSSPSKKEDDKKTTGSSSSKKEDDKKITGSNASKKEDDKKTAGSNASEKEEADKTTGSNASKKEEADKTTGSDISKKDDVSKPIDNNMDNASKKLTDTIKHKKEEELEKKRQHTREYMKKQDFVYLRLPSKNEELGIPDYKQMVKDYAAGKGVSVNALLTALVENELKIKITSLAFIKENMKSQAKLDIINK